MGGFGPSDDLVLFATGGNLTADYGDALELLNRGYLTGRRQESNSFSASVSPEAHEFMKATSAKASSLVREGTRKVQVVQSTSDLTAVGHKIREAMQEFSDVLYVEYVPGAAATPIERNRTRNKIAAFAEYVKPLIG